MKLLLDENISPRLVPRLAERGLYAQHIVHLGRAGMSDRDVWKYAYENDQVVVSQNAADFIELAAISQLHPGLIVLRVGSLSVAEQWQYLQPVLDHLLIERVDPINKLVEILAPGEFTIRDLPRA